MDAALVSLLQDKNKVDKTLVAYIGSIGCNTVATFANWVDTKAEIGDAFLKNSPLKGNLAEQANLKMAWREAEGLVTRGIKRAADGLDNEALDDPLQEGVFKTVTQAFKTQYNWQDNLDSRRVGNDSLHGRFRREFERKQPSMYSFLKAKPLSMSTKEPPIKKTKLSNELELHATTKDDVMGQATLSKWFSSFDIVTNTWAVTGCFDVTHKGETRKYAHWAELTSYLYEFQAKANELRDTHYGDTKIYLYLSAMEEEFRAKAIELCRSGEEVPFGDALKRSIKENAHLWQEKRHLVEGQQQRSGGGRGNYQSNLQPLPAASFQTPKNPSNSPCKFFNSNNGCTNKKCQFAHTCNRKLQSGKLCGQNHVAQSHDEGKHGKVQEKSGKPKGGGKKK